MALPSIFDKTAVIHRDLILRSVAADTTVILPAGGSVYKIVMQNRTANAVTGGIRVGTAAAGAQVLAATPVAGTPNPVYTNPTADPLAAAAQTLFISAVTAWNGAVVDIMIKYTETNTL